jgi:hypothetical protein
LKKFGLQRTSPDTLLAGLYDRIPDLTIGSLAKARSNLSKTQVSASEFINILDRHKLTRLAKRVQARVSDL